MFAYLGWERGVAAVAAAVSRAKQIVMGSTMAFPQEIGPIQMTIIRWDNNAKRRCGRIIRKTQ